MSFCTLASLFLAILIVQKSCTLKANLCAKFSNTSRDLHSTPKSRYGAEILILVVSHLGASVFLASG